MLIRKLALAGVFAFHAMPALGQDLTGERRPQPKPIASFAVAERSVELIAVTRRARADTRFHRAYMKDCAAMSKVMPGYPQPALLSFDMRVKF